MPYFLYKPQNISNLGGVFPNPHDEFDLGITERDGYYLGYVENPESISKIKDYFVCFLDDDTAEGFKLLDVTQIPTDPDNPESEYRELTSEELANQNKAKRLMLKLQLRDKIDANVGDIPDIIADLNKRVDLLERLVMRMAYYLLQNQSIPTEIHDKYFSLVEQYITAVDNGTIKTRTDLEDPSEVFNKLSNRMNTLVNLVKSEYLDKLPTESSTESSSQ